MKLKRGLNLTFFLWSYNNEIYKWNQHRTLHFDSNSNAKHENCTDSIRKLGINASVYMPALVLLWLYNCTYILHQYRSVHFSFISQFSDTVWIRNLGTKGNVYVPVLVEDICVQFYIHGSTNAGMYTLPLFHNFLILTVYNLKLNKWSAPWSGSTKFDESRFGSRFGSGSIPDPG